MTNLPKLKLFLIFIFFFLDSAVIQAADIKFTPQSPLVEIGKSIVLSVSGTEGQVRWMAFDGQIEGDGNQVTYFAPTQVGKDTVTVKDSVGSTTVDVVITAPNVFSLENAVWEVFTNRNTVTALALSEDGKTLWVGTEGGLEKRDAQTGKIQQVFTRIDGLPSNVITVLLNDGLGGVWVASYNRLCLSYDYENDKCYEVEENGGLAHLTNQGEWVVYTKENLKLPGKHINTLLQDGQGGLWVDTDEGLAHLNSQNEWIVYSSEKPNDYIQALSRSEEHSKPWVDHSEDGSELIHLDDSTVIIRENVGLSSADFDNLFSDKRGGLWAISFSKIIHLDYQGKQTIYLDDIDWDRYGIIADKVGGLWIKTVKGLVHLDNQGEEKIFKKSDLEDLLPPGDENEQDDFWSTLWNATVFYSDGQEGLWITKFLDRK